MKINNDVMTNILIAVLTLAMIVGCMVSLYGCALERADPAAKSARATYGAVSIVVSGDNSTATISLGDGAFTAADGDGDVKQDSTLTTRQDADLSGPVSAANPITAGINAVANVATAGINAYVATKTGSGVVEGQKSKVEGQKSKVEGQETIQPSTGTQDCPDCEPTGNQDCPDCEPDEEHYP